MGRLIRRLKENSSKGEGAYIRIQNKSSVSIDITITESRNVDETGKKEIQGTIPPGKQLPSKGTNKFGDGCQYQYIEGDVTNRLQKDGYLKIQATPKEGSNTKPSSLELKVDHDSWESRDNTPDKDSCIILVADVEEDDDTNEWKIELRVFDSFNGSKWMEQMASSIASKRLCDLGIPGTHDSGTYKFDKSKGASPDSDLTKTIQEKLDHGKLLGKVTDWILDTIFARLCQCQDQSFQQQLEHGIRYLDMRVAYHDSSKLFYTCHGVHCVEMKDAMKEIGTFLKRNPKEIVIMEFKGLYNMDGHHEELLDLVIQGVGGETKVADKDEIHPSSTVQEYWDKGYQAVILYKDRSAANKYEGKVWPIKFITSKWPNTGDTKVLKQKMQEAFDTSKKDDLFFVLQGILTPDTELIKKELLDGSGVSIKDFATSCSGKVVNWVEEEWKPKRCINIVIVDFFQNCSILPAIINYNRA